MTEPIEEPPQDDGNQDDGNELLDGHLRAAAYRQAADLIEDLSDEAASRLREKADELEAEDE